MGAVSFRSVECRGYRVTFDDRMIHDFWYTEEGANDLIGSLRPGIQNIEVITRAHAKGCCMGYTLVDNGDDFGMSIFPAKRFTHPRDREIHKVAKTLSKRRHIDHCWMYCMLLMPLEFAPAATDKKAVA